MRREDLPNVILESEDDYLFICDFMNDNGFRWANGQTFGYSNNSYYFGYNYYEDSKGYIALSTGTHGVYPPRYTGMMMSKSKDFIKSSDFIKIISSKNKTIKISEKIYVGHFLGKKDIFKVEEYIEGFSSFYHIDEIRFDNLPPNIRLATEQEIKLSKFNNPK